MRTFIKYIVVFISCMISFADSHAKIYEGMFGVRHIDRTHGLSSERVFSIVEDDNNVMWISTRTGIDRYNGHMVKNYSLTGNFYYGDMAGRIIRLTFDENYGLLAYDHTGRIYKYQPETDSFEPYLYLGRLIEGEIILNKLCVDDDGNLWFGLNNGLFKNGEGGEIENIIPGRYINDISYMNDSLFVATSTGVFQLPFSSPKDVCQIVGEKNVQTLYCDTINQRIWIGTFNSGLWTFDINTSSINRIDDNNSCFLNPIRAITPYNDSGVLIGIDGGGVYFVDNETTDTQFFMNTEDSGELFLKGNGVYAITTDFQNNIWIGSYTGGISVAISLRYPMTVLTHQRGNVQSLANNNVNDIEENINGDLWFATDDGISIRNASDYKWKHILKSTVAVALCKGSNGNVWAGTYGDGLYLIDKTGNVVRHLNQTSCELTTNYIFSVKEDSDGDLWVGGLNGNLIILDKAGRLKREFEINWVHSIESFEGDKMAVATVNGFCIVDKHTGDLKRYATTRDFNDKNVSAYIISLLFNDDGTVWFGTEGGGLNLYNINTGEVRTFTANEGMLSDDIYSLQRDSKGRIWASTGSGLAVVDGLNVTNLNYIYGTDRTYNKSACYKLSDGRLAYGSTDGAVFITPEAVTMEDYKAPIRITDLRVEYISSDAAKQMRPYIYQMLMDKEVNLDYSYNSFTVSFESINYRFQHDIAYQYILEGYEKSWSEIYTNGIVRYTNVSPGMYTLKIRSLRKSNGDIISEEAINVNIAQPWWNSWYAWIVYVSIIGGIFYFILRYKANQIQKKYNEDKIKFFVETAHDIRTPVTLIMAPLEDLCKETGFSQNVRYLLDTALRNTHKLHTLVTQLMEFEKIDTHKKAIVLKPVNVVELLLNECASFQNFCDKKQLHIKISMPEDDVYAMADQQLLEMLFDNLISNACKYTMPHGTITLSVHCKKNSLVIEVRDNGIGIPPDAKGHLFKNVYRAENARQTHETGTGFGLLQVWRIVNMMNGRISYDSEINKGSVFYVTLKRANIDSTYVNEEVVIDREILPSVIEGSKENHDSDGIVDVRKDSANTLLIVEDNDELRLFLRKIFEHDYNVIDVADGEKALDCLSQEYPDLILSDVMMPGIQGDELCRIVKENPQTSGIPFILLTAKVTHDAMVAGLKKGADDYIPKPFSAEVLRLKVRSILETRNHQREFIMKQVLSQTSVHDSLKIEDKQPEDAELNDKETSENVSTPLSEDDFKFIQQATKLVLDNLDDVEFNINQLCQEMAMSRTLFYNRLKSLTGKAPQDFIRLIRLQRAAELLKQGKSVVDAATETGFVNTKYFSILFKKQFGIQPSKFLEQDK